MTKTIEAIYEDGVFRPEDGVGLPERQRVRLIVETLDEPGEESERKARRREALQRFRESVEQSSFYLTGPLPTRDELHER